MIVEKLQMVIVLVVQMEVVRMVLHFVIALKHREVARG